MENIFFDSWHSTIRTLIITVLAYIILVFMLRVSGKRTLSKMNAFDFIITIALGSTFASVALNKNVALIDGALVFFLLIMLQFIITWLSVRYSSVKTIITSQPTLLLYKGRLLQQSMKKERINLEEIYVAARKKGITHIDKIGAVVLETTGDLTIIPDVDNLQGSALKDVEKPLQQ